MFLLILLSLSHCKIVKNVLELTPSEPAKYLTKFGVDLGLGKWEIKLKLLKGRINFKNELVYEVPLLLIRDSDWSDSVLTCQNTEKALKKTLQIPSDGTWSAATSGSLGESEEPHIWFFVFTDCNKILGDSSKVRFELSILSGDESELPVEMKGLKRIYMIVCVIFTGLLGRNIFNLYKHFTDLEEVEAILVMLNLAVFFEFISMIFQIFHITAYENNGKGVPVFQFFGTSGNFISGFLMIFLVLIIAQGWGITLREIPSPKVYVYFFVMAGFAFLHFALAALEISFSDSCYLFSEFDGITGWLVFGFRITVLGWMAWNVQGVIDRVPDNVCLFMSRFRLAAAGYILALPGLILVAQVLPPYKRHKFIVGGNIVVQGFAMFVLSWLFTSKKQLYKISVVSASILPVRKSHNY